jgi:acetylornithine deacetylase
LSELNPEDVAAAVGGYDDQAREWLSDMIRFRSVQGNEREVQAYVLDLIRTLGVEAEYREIPEDIFDDPEYTHNENEQSYEGRSNVVATRKGSGGGRSLIVQSHTDVVPEAEWTEAFDPTWDGEFLWGRGSTDAKGQVMTILLALAALNDLGVELAGDLEAQVVIEEEVGGNGALALIRQGCTADGVVVLEGSRLNVFPANRGAIWFQAKTTGKSLHMGRRNEGVNAIEKMMEVIARMLDYEKELIADSANYPLFERYEAPVQICIGMISAGGWPSMVAGECEMEGGVGFLPNKEMEQVKQELYDAVMKTDDEWLKEHFELRFDKLHNDAYEFPADHPLPVTLNAAVREFGVASEIFGWNVSCDARLYAKLAGIPTVVYGPSDIAEAHAAGEKVRWAEVLDAAKGLALGIERWCNGGQ